MDAFFENAQRIFDVARLDASSEPKDFALLIRPDGGLHFVMESPLSLEAAAVHGGARIAYRVTKSLTGEVRVSGRSETQECMLTAHRQTTDQNSSRRFSSEILRDQPRYWISSPLTLSAPS